MSVLLLTSWPARWKELGRITHRLMVEYAAFHGYLGAVWDESDCFENVETVAGVMPWPIKGFVKFDMMLANWDKADVLVWMDADAVITNRKVKVEAFLARHPEAGVITGHDHNGTHTTVIIVRTTHPLAYDFIWACNNIGRKFFLTHDWHEMEALKYFAKEPPYADIGMVKTISNADLGGIRWEEYVKVGLPERVSKKYSWKPHDFLLNLSGLPDGRRLRLAEHYADPARHFKEPPPGPDAENP